MGTKETKEKIKKIIEHAKEALKQDLEDFGIVGNGFWESVEAELLAVIEE